MIQEIINFLNTYIKAHGCTEMNKWVEFLEQIGWHPASELPELNEYGNSEPVYALYGTNNSRLLPMISFVIEGKWHDNNIKYWCYPPKTE